MQNAFTVTLFNPVPILEEQNDCGCTIVTVVRLQPFVTDKFG